MTDPPLTYGDHVEYDGDPSIGMGVVRHGPPTHEQYDCVYVEFRTGVCGWYDPAELRRVGGNGDAK